MNSSTSSSRADRRGSALLIALCATIPLLIAGGTLLVTVTQGRRFWVRLREKGGKQHDMPAHHVLEQYIDEYLAAAGIGSMVPIDLASVPGSFPCPVEVRTDDPEGCPAFYGRVIRGVKNGPSPQWLQDRLRAVGAVEIRRRARRRRLSLRQRVERRDDATCRLWARQPSCRICAHSGMDDQRSLEQRLRSRLRARARL